MGKWAASFHHADRLLCFGVHSDISTAWPVKKAGKAWGNGMGRALGLGQGEALIAR